MVKIVQMVSDQLGKMVKIVQIVLDGSALSDGEDCTDGLCFSDGEDCTDG